MDDSRTSRKHYLSSSPSPPPVTGFQIPVKAPTSAYDGRSAFAAAPTRGRRTGVTSAPASRSTSRRAPHDVTSTPSRGGSPAPSMSSTKGKSSQKRSKGDSIKGEIESVGSGTQSLMTSFSEMSERKTARDLAKYSLQQQRESYQNAREERTQVEASNAISHEREMTRIKAQVEASNAESRVIQLKNQMLDREIQLLTLKASLKMGEDN
ncbi:hypothetical protein BJ138DRAFT_1229820 [Hygrophoropsis aurantiaca]|uniref:Uncharacterized protein n=1 Tax=Hygrophoropsis aurantiaca TaxID=72124 RepID=A0ACB7ZXG5_9AGAM|nr:hypothetical protein BJ138DRAFT_1229820 [Hygrophoropsis aurantiaca]